MTLLDEKVTISAISVSSTLRYGSSGYDSDFISWTATPKTELTIPEAERISLEMSEKISDLIYITAFAKGKVSVDTLNGQLASNKKRFKYVNSKLPEKIQNEH